MERKNLKTAIKRARALRVLSTEAERKLWSLVRGRQLDGAKFRRQLPIDRYFADFACVEARLIVELDGTQHAAQAAYDAERTRVLEASGWHVMRIWNNELFENIEGVGLAILAELKLARG